MTTDRSAEILGLNMAIKTVCDQRDEAAGERDRAEQAIENYRWKYEGVIAALEARAVITETALQLMLETHGCECGTCMTAVDALARPDEERDDVRDGLELMADAMATPSTRVLIDCPYCHGNGSIDYNPSRNSDPQYETSAPCPTCRGEGAVPARTWDIVVCVLCLEHVNDCQCDVNEVWSGPEPPTMTLTVELAEEAS